MGARCDVVTPVLIPKAPGDKVKTDRRDTHKHEAWLAAQSFAEPALNTTFGHYRAVVLPRDAALAAVEADLVPWFDRAPFAHAVHRLGADRGVTRIGALSLQAEVCDWRRFGRAASFMGFLMSGSSESMG